MILDHSTPKPLMRHLAKHNCRTAAQMQWDRLKNGDLLKASEEAGFDLMVTCDRNLRYQQNLQRRRIAVVEITTNYWPLIEPQCHRVSNAVDEANVGSYSVVEIALPPKQMRLEGKY